MHFFVAPLLSSAVITETYTSNEPANLSHTQQIEVSYANVQHVC